MMTQQNRIKQWIFQDFSLYPMKIQQNSVYGNAFIFNFMFYVLKIKIHRDSKKILLTKGFLLTTLVDFSNQSFQGEGFAFVIHVFFFLIFGFL